MAVIEDRNIIVDAIRIANWITRNHSDTKKDESNNKESKCEDHAEYIEEEETASIAFTAANDTRDSGDEKKYWTCNQHTDHQSVPVIGRAIPDTSVFHCAVDSDTNRN